MIPIGVQGLKAVAAEQQHSLADRMKTVDIFVRRNRFENFFRANMRRQRQLDQNAVNVFVFVELVHEREQFSFRNRRRQQMLERFDADFLARFFFVAHVNVRRRIVAHQYHRQARRHAPAPLQTFDFFFDLFLNFLGDGFAVDNRGHE